MTAVRAKRLGSIRYIVRCKGGGATSCKRFVLSLPALQARVSLHAASCKLGVPAAEETACTKSSVLVWMRC